MTATSQTLARPGFRGRTVSIALAAVFAVGMLTGLAAARVPWPTLVPVAEPATARDAGWQAYLDYRAGERALPTVSYTQAELEKAWMDFRAGEREADGSR
jgi:hypothetical protein